MNESIFDKRNGVIILLIMSILLAFKPMALVFFLSVIVSVNLLIRIFSPSREIYDQKPYFSLICYMASVIFLLFLLPTDVLLILGIFGVLLINVWLIRNKKIGKTQAVVNSAIVFILIIFVVSEYPINSGVFTTQATFTTKKASTTIEFNKGSQRESEDFAPISYSGWDKDADGVWRCLLFIAIRTDFNNDLGYLNYDQANFHAFVNISEYMPDSTAKFWNTSINIDLVYYGSYLKDRILEEKKYGYDLLTLIEQLAPYTEYYNSSSGKMNASIDASHVLMGDYLLCVDLVIKPTADNKVLYDQDFATFDAYFGFEVSGDLNYGYEVQSEGYAYIVQYLTPQSEAGQFFDDLIGNDIWNLAILFMIIFFITIVLAIIQRSYDIIKMMQIVLIVLFVCGLFAVVSVGMNEVPTWMQVLFPLATAQYIWAVIEIVKYALIMGMVLAIIFTISTYICTSFDAVFGKLMGEDD